MDTCITGCIDIMIKLTDYSSLSYHNGHAKYFATTA